MTTRQKMLREALEIIRKLWEGGHHSYEGEYFEVASARVFDLPEKPVPIAALGRVLPPGLLETASVSRTLG